MLAATLRTAHDLDLAEECVQEAYAGALLTWDRDGVPARPGAWLTTVARRKAVDALRRESRLRPRLPLLVESALGDDEGSAPEASQDPGAAAVSDDRLRLIFMCCHPALSDDAQVALTLRLVCGVSAADIARLLFVSEPTMNARLTRAKKKISVARIPVRIPDGADLAPRLRTVLSVIYLLFTVGHTAPSGPSLVRAGVADEAVRLSRLAHERFPAEPETAGLLALCLATDARRDARVDDSGQAVRLADQDRANWDRRAIEEARRLVAPTLRDDDAGRYALQAAIALAHAEAPSFEDVDWEQIVRLYDRLLVAWPSPVVALNRAVAVAKTRGPAAALAEVEDLERDGRLGAYHYLPAVKAHLLEQLGRSREAEIANRRALELATNDVERAFLAGHATLRSDDD